MWFISVLQVFYNTLFSVLHDPSYMSTGNCFHCTISCNNNADINDMSYACSKTFV